MPPDRVGRSYVIDARFLPQQQTVLVLFSEKSLVRHR